MTALGFELCATASTADTLESAGIRTQCVRKLAEQAPPNLLDLMQAGCITLAMYTRSGLIARADKIRIRHDAVRRAIPIVTTEDGARATVAAIRHARQETQDMTALQDL